MSAHHHERTRRRVGGDDCAADVLVVGAGPAGATAATHLARAGLDVLVLEKAAFPREKVCGDGLTPRAVKQLIDLGIDTRPEAGWLHNRGLRVYGAGLSVDLDWPDLTSFPPYGMVRPRRDFDQLLADHARAAGARVQERTSVSGVLTDERTGRVVGVEARRGPEREPVTYRAPLVVACDGVGARTALSRGIAKRDDRPLGVAVRRYYTSPKSTDDYLETHLELTDGRGGLLPGYGWVFGMGDGTANVGLGILDRTNAAAGANYRATLRAWCDSLPGEWGLREENAVNEIGGAALPMGFNRTPVYADGLLLVGDAGGMVNSFNGEGIAYAMQSASLAAEAVVQALARPEGPSRERALAAYPEAVRAELASYYRLGNRFAHALRHPWLVRTTARYGLPRRRVMAFLLKLLANLHDGRDGDASDRLLEVLLRLTPALPEAAPRTLRPTRPTRPAVGKETAA
ncbi:geranylgeranyl reductase family protein [Actinomycetospora soli]|uniref:geranylgeranyl reductase family protein n=1 Tax=Actinomycetospora soli TaxID=2893887 RepID=UPI001E2AA9E2|nr:geranylgeranyl reductase family protein [Actinomycetospora soli]MCD2190868.1 geranylgeranyl reductase family protein [Actinomycetospora soli]